MNVLDEAAWEREINHANRVQVQIKPKQIGTIGVADTKRVPPAYTIVPLLWHKTGAEYEK